MKTAILNCTKQGMYLLYMPLSAQNLFSAREKLTVREFMIVTIEICGVKDLSNAMAGLQQQGIKRGYVEKKSQHLVKVQTATIERTPSPERDIVLEVLILGTCKSIHSSVT